MSEKRGKSAGIRHAPDLVICEGCSDLAGSSPCLRCKSVEVSAEDMLRAILSQWYATGPVPPRGSVLGSQSFSMAEVIWAVEDFLGEA